MLSSNLGKSKKNKKGPNSRLKSTVLEKKDHQVVRVKKQPTSVLSVGRTKRVIKSFWQYFVTHSKQEVGSHNCLYYSNILEEKYEPLKRVSHILNCLHTAVLEYILIQYRL